MRRLSIVSVLSTLHGSWPGPSLEKQQHYWCKKLSNVLLRMGAAAKRYFSFNLPSDKVKLLFFSKDPGGFRAVVTTLSIVIRTIKQ